MYYNAATLSMNTVTYQRTMSMLTMHHYSSCLLERSEPVVQESKTPVHFGKLEHQTILSIREYPRFAELPQLRSFESTTVSYTTPHPCSLATSIFQNQIHFEVLGSTTVLDITHKSKSLIPLQYH